jgi:hypothetical protein
MYFSTVFSMCVLLYIIPGGAKRTHVFQLSTEKALNSNNGIVISKKLLDGKNAVLNVPLLHGYRTDPSALFSGGVGRSPTFTLPTTTHFKNMRSFCATRYNLRKGIV